MLRNQYHKESEIMRKVRIGWIGVAAVLALFAGACSSSGSSVAAGEGGMGLLAFVPRDAAGVVLVNVDAFSKLAVFDEVVKPDGEKGNEALAMLNKMGIDPKKDIHAMAMGLFGNVEEKPQVLAVIGTSLQVAALEKALEGSGHVALAHEQVSGKDCLKLTDKNDQDTLFLFQVSDQVLAVSNDSALLGRAMGLVGNEAQSFLKDGRSSELKGKDALVSLVMAVPPKMKEMGSQGGGMFQMDFSKAEALSGHVAFVNSAWTGSLRLVQKDEAANNQVVQTLNGLKAMAGMSSPELGELVSKVTLSGDAQAITLEFSIPHDTIKKLKEKMADKIGAPAPEQNGEQEGAGAESGQESIPE